MFENIGGLVESFENGRLTRRQLIGQLGALMAAAAGVREASAATETPKPTFQTLGLNHLAIRVTDVARSRDWYVKHLGLTVVRDGRANCFMRCGDDFLALFRSGEASMDHYCYTIEDYEPDRVVKRLTAAGLKPERHENRVYFPDPDGLTVQLSAENDWKDWQ